MLRFAGAAENPVSDSVREFARYYHTFRTMRYIEHTDTPVDGCFCVSVDVKKRYIDPLVSCGLSENGCFRARRITEISENAADCVRRFLSFRDTTYGCVHLSAT